MKEKDLEEAKQIQESMLPKSYPQIDGLSITAGLITSTEVGGDYYDFLKVMIKIKVFMLFVVTLQVMELLQG